MDSELYYAETQREARRWKLYSYYTGRPCLRGHYSPRYACSRKCIACHQEDYPLGPPTRRPITITQRPTLPWAAGWARKLDDPMKGWAPELREREERRLADCDMSVVARQ